MDRPGLESALDMVAQGEASSLVIYAYDRLARNLNHQAVITYRVEDQQGGKLLSVTEEHDDSPMVALMRTFRGVMAEEERKKILERTQRGKRQRARDGAHAATVAAYGYTWTADRRAYAIDPATAPIVRRIFAEVTAGRSTNAVAVSLTQDGIPTPSERLASTHANGKRAIAAAWNGETVRKMLLNPVYRGEPVAFRHERVKERIRNPETGEMKTVRHAIPGKSPIPLQANAAPAIITSAEWRVANEQMQRNKAESARSSTHAGEHLLRAGFVYCGSCGRKLYAQTARSKGQPQYRYACYSRFGGRGYTCEAGAIVSAPLLDADIWQKVQVVLNTDAVCGRSGIGQEKARATQPRWRGYRLSWRVMTAR